LDKRAAGQSTDISGQHLRLWQGTENSGVSVNSFAKQYRLNYRQLMSFVMADGKLTDVGRKRLEMDDQPVMPAPGNVSGVGPERSVPGIAGSANAQVVSRSVAIETPQPHSEPTSNPVVRLGRASEHSVADRGKRPRTASSPDAPDKP
jgi:hypothetical protein